MDRHRMGWRYYIRQVAAPCNGARGKVCYDWRQLPSLFLSRIEVISCCCCCRCRCHCRCRYVAQLFSALSVYSISPITKNKCIGDDTKAAAHRSPNVVRKTKKTTFCGTPLSVILPNFYEKLLLLSLKLDNRLLSYGRKRIFFLKKMAVKCSMWNIMYIMLTYVYCTVT